MGSNLHNIVPALVSILQEVTALNGVYSYIPDGPPPTPFLVFDLSGWNDIHEAQQEAAYEWQLSGYLVFNATNTEEATKQLLLVLPQILDIMGQNLSANGTIAGGDVLVYPGRPRGTVTVAKIAFPARELVFKVRERYAFDWTLGD